MCHLIIFKSLISKDDAATKDRYHLSLGITSLYDTYTVEPRYKSTPAIRAILRIPVLYYNTHLTPDIRA